MISISNFPNAYMETYTILQNIEQKNLEQIPKKFILLIENKMNKNYKFEIDDNIFTQNILQETKVILAYIFLNYWGTEEQNQIIKKKFRQDIIEQEKQKPKYNRDQLFKRNGEN